MALYRYIFITKHMLPGLLIQLVCCTFGRSSGPLKGGKANDTAASEQLDL